MSPTIARKQHIVIVGAGINGLVAANYLKRAGFNVTMLERKLRVGGACISATARYRTTNIEYLPGASVLGMMQRFIFRDTGLHEQISTFTPQHPDLVYFGDSSPVRFYDSPTRLRDELRIKWNEQGDPQRFLRDSRRVTSFLRRGYRLGITPTLQAATKTLGKKLVSLWITGSAKQLLNQYFTSEKMKTFLAIPVTEGGPVSLDEPYSAFTIALMSSGNVLAGKWGFVKGGISQISDALACTNKLLGVRTITGARVVRVDSNRDIKYRLNAKYHTLSCDLVVFATDPLSAAEAFDDTDLIENVRSKRLMGTSGKAIMFFKRPIRWKHDTGAKDFHAAFRTIIQQADLDSFCRSTNAVTKTGVDFSPGYLEIYPEGPAMELMGVTQKFHTLSIFIKDIGPWKPGKSLSNVKRYVVRTVLNRIENRIDFIKAIFLSPKDLQRLFFFPGGHIDHVEIAQGQTFCTRSYSADPKNSFYQFGGHKWAFYCGAGSYPCGSVAGTAGYMCAKYLIRMNHKRS